MNAIRMSLAAILAAITLTGCATNYQQAIDKAQDAKYNRCVDKIHAMQKDGQRINWNLEVEACMGRKDDTYMTYQSQRATKLPPRVEWESK